MTVLIAFGLLLLFVVATLGAVIVTCRSDRRVRRRRRRRAHLQAHPRDAVTREPSPRSVVGATPVGDQDTDHLREHQDDDAGRLRDRWPASPTI